MLWFIFKKKFIGYILSSPENATLKITELFYHTSTDYAKFENTWLYGCSFPCLMSFMDVNVQVCMSTDIFILSKPVLNSLFAILIYVHFVALSTWDVCLYENQPSLPSCATYSSLLHRGEVFYYENLIFYIASIDWG